MSIRNEMMSVKPKWSIRGIGFRALEIALKKFNLLRGIKHDLSDHVAEEYYARLCKCYIDKYVEGLFEGKGERKILDVGCGAGRFAVELAALGHKVTGVDYMPEALEKAGRNANKRGVSIDLKCGNAEVVLKNLDDEYDLILCLEMLYVTSRYREIMADMRGLLTQQGILVCSHRPKHYFITTLLAQRRYKSALRVARSTEGVIALNRKPVYYNWQTKEELSQLYNELDLNLIGLHPIGMFSGFGVDGMAEIANPEIMNDREKKSLFELETEKMKDYQATGRYILAVSSKRKR